MKTAISIPDPVFQEAERTARRLKVSRSELYRLALEAFLSGHRDSEVTASYDEAFAENETPAERSFRKRAVRRLLRGAEWNE
jgi:hypothetical protein